MARQELAEALVARVHQIQHGVKQEGQEIEGGQQGGEVCLAVAEVVGQVIAFGFKRIVVSVLHLPAGATVAYDVGYVGFADRMIGGKGVFIST